MATTDLSAEVIAASVGVPYATVNKWNQRFGWRPSARRTLAALRPGQWPTPRVLACSRVYEAAGVDPGDLAEALGLRRDRADALFRELGFPEGAARPDPATRTADGLRTALRAHVARQIAEFDASLADRARRRGGRFATGADGLDSTKVLRDLGGLKRLLDDLDAGPPAPAVPDRPAAWDRAGTGARDGWGRPLPVGDGMGDLAALREEIACRIEGYNAQCDADERAARESASEAGTPAAPGGPGAGAAPRASDPPFTGPRVSAL